jgi:hypothetical protein
MTLTPPARPNEAGKPAFLPSDVERSLRSRRVFEIRHARPRHSGERCA